MQSARSMRWRLSTLTPCPFMVSLISLMMVVRAASMPRTFSISIMWLPVVWLPFTPSTPMTSARPYPSTNNWNIFLPPESSLCTIARSTLGKPCTGRRGSVFFRACSAKNIPLREWSDGRMCSLSAAFTLMSGSFSLSLESASRARFTVTAFTSSRRAAIVRMHSLMDRKQPDGSYTSAMYSAIWPSVVSSMRALALRASNSLSGMFRLALITGVLMILLALMISLMRGTPCVMFMLATPAKWKVFSVICVHGSPID
mmetsp:Transcript_52664/g.132467  ORF Transcript_52664/g.132467 Transcript_52664/m.132467 type:complete len:257 (+) Transcript_52664:841-1611(+)